jgi:hypothetical protein
MLRVRGESPKARETRLYYRLGLGHKYQREDSKNLLGITRVGMRFSRHNTSIILLSEGSSRGSGETDEAKSLRSNLAHSRPRRQTIRHLSSLPPRRGREGCPPPTTNVCPWKVWETGTLSMMNGHPPTQVPCDPQPTTARVPLIHPAPKTKMSRSCKRRLRGRWGWRNVLDMPSPMSRYAPSARPPAKTKYSTTVLPVVQKRPSSLRYLLISLGALVAISVMIGIVSAFTYSGTATFHGKLKATLDHISNGTFRPDVQSLLWVPEGVELVPSCACAIPDVLCFQPAMECLRP